MTVETYDHMREMELEAALREARADIEAGGFVRESVADHVGRVTAVPAGLHTLQVTTARRRDS